MFKLFKENNEVTLMSPMTGEVIDIKEVPDEVFSSGMIGDGIAIKPSEGKVVSPCDGKILNVFPTNHAIGILSKEGVEILIHIGLDTVELKGEGFKRIVQQGDKVKAGDPLVEVDIDFISNQGKSTITPIIIINKENVKEIIKHSGSVMAQKDKIMTIKVNS